jgi:glutamate mutase epsilon subunit
MILQREVKDYIKLPKGKTNIKAMQEVVKMLAIVEEQVEM